MSTASPVIRLENVDVAYRRMRESARSVQELVINAARTRLRTETFHALRGLSLDVMPGEVLGLHGHNGAGKSTLLKLVARVMVPTAGRVEVHGNVAPLLQLGAGFDPDLPGRENVFLNGMILGYRKRDLAQRFDRIVEYSGVGEFIDQPLRTYSSGMTARLGFAIATDVRPDILLLDEIAAVGDSEFQQQSTARIREYIEQGTTALVVSHSRAYLRSICDRIAVMSHGQLQSVMPVADFPASDAPPAAAKPAAPAVVAPAAPAAAESNTTPESP